LSEAAFASRLRSTIDDLPVAAGVHAAAGFTHVPALHVRPGPHATPPLGRQTPAWHVSPVVQRSPSSQLLPFGCGVCVHFPRPLQASAVHATPSDAHAVPASSSVQRYWNEPTGTHACWHSGWISHGLPAWTLHAPPLQKSWPLQTFASLHGAVLLRCLHSPPALQTSSVQTLPSSRHGVPAPSRWQVGEQQSPA
jgi:hypothetical protein